VAQRFIECARDIAKSLARRPATPSGQGKNSDISDRSPKTP
jgi:hypothetical protein